MPNRKKTDIQFEQPSDILLLANRYLMIIISLIIITIILLSYFLLLAPKIDQISKSKETTINTEHRRESNEELLASIKKLEAEYYDIINNRQEDLDFLKKMVPIEPQTAKIFLMSDILAKQYGFQLADIDITTDAAQVRSVSSVETVEAGNDANKIDSIDKLLASSDMKAATIKLSIGRDVEEGEAVLGSDIYNDFKDYLAALENNIRLLDVKSIIFDSIDAEPGSDGPSSYIFNINLITYYK